MRVHNNMYSQTVAQPHNTAGQTCKRPTQSVPLLTQVERINNTNNNNKN